MLGTSRRPTGEVGEGSAENPPADAAEERTENPSERPAAQLTEKLLGPEFSCVAGKSAQLRGTLVHRHFGRLAEPATTRELHAALADFAARREDIDPLMATFAATFSGPADTDETEFEELLWRQLQALHDLDTGQYPWDPQVDPDPASERFGFSVGGHAFFVVGLHPGASRITRRFPLPTLVFNSHLQFGRLKEKGIYQRIQGQVRERELELQGSLNPNLSEFGAASEAVQYSGRAVPEDWTCPFRPAAGAYPAHPASAAHQADPEESRTP
ncbi:YqcI/YcgG family protein [Streptomyces sp. NBC_00663]|uniref:guanitoxin biosynthesis heme-dependent pre-guanitoxin N-hydroxylase GntA n=1 Tax=Streptomyces sp. NBC_00663 TaxID=2975801 RepID=UPI002E359244|nr:guanitoxin biosynthesis heme-dependent pre-guanitoxin N-hydroxylase GntA [Streptomyces sp. NBC_00663]